MKKITLLLMALLTIVGGANAGQTVVYKNTFATGKTNNFTLDKSLFSDIKEGDVIWVSSTDDVDGATAANEEWYQMNVKIAGDTWTSIASYYNMSPLGLWSHTVTADEAAKIKAYGLYFEGHFINIKEVAFGDAFSTTAVQHWDSENNVWSTDDYVLSDDKNTWNSQTLNTSGQLSTALIGDRITVNYTTDASDDEWNARVVLYDATNNDSWVTIYDYPAGKSNSVSFVVTDDNYSRITAGDIRLGGCNYTVTSINLETSSYTYELSANNSNVDVEQLPTTYPVDVRLTRKYDWNTTICLPFDVADVATAFGNDAKAYEFKEYGANLVFTERESIEAGKPYYMTFNMDGVSESDKTMTKTFDDVTITTALNNTDESNGLTFKGNYTSGFDMEGKYGVACLEVSTNNWVWGFYKGGSGSTLNKYSAYFDGSISPTARLGIVLEGDNTTGISTMMRENVNGGYYNLNGQRVENLAKGLFIVNGKKVIVK